MSIKWRVISSKRQNLYKTKKNKIKKENKSSHKNHMALLVKETKSLLESFFFSVGVRALLHSTWLFSCDVSCEQKPGAVPTANAPKHTAGKHNRHTRQMHTLHCARLMTWILCIGAVSYARKGIHTNIHVTINRVIGGIKSKKCKSW